MFFAYLMTGDEVVAARSATTRSRAISDLLQYLPRRAWDLNAYDCGIKVLETLYDLEDAHARHARQNAPRPIVHAGETRGLRGALWLEQFDPKRAQNDDDATPPAEEVSR